MFVHSTKSPSLSDSSRYVTSRRRTKSRRTTQPRTDRSEGRKRVKLSSSLSVSGLYLSGIEHKEGMVGYHFCIYGAENCECRICSRSLHRNRLRGGAGLNPGNRSNRSCTADVHNLIRPWATNQFFNRFWGQISVMI